MWETLEHGEKVECLDCIPLVAPLLYDSNAKTREIAAWSARPLARIRAITAARWKRSRPSQT